MHKSPEQLASEINALIAEPKNLEGGDLVKQLRELDARYIPRGATGQIVHEQGIILDAADRIEELQSKLARAYMLLTALGESREDWRNKAHLGLVEIHKLNAKTKALLAELDRIVADNQRFNSASRNAITVLTDGCTYNKDGTLEFYCGDPQLLYEAISATAETPPDSESATLAAA